MENRVTVKANFNSPNQDSSRIVIMDSHKDLGSNWHVLGNIYIL